MKREPAFAKANVAENLSEDQLTTFSDEPNATKVIIISHREFLTLEQVVEIARDFYEVRLAPECLDILAHSRESLVRKIAVGETIYGVNTGFGGNAKYLIPPD